MADRSKKQLIYKDYSAVNTNGSSLNVDLTENSSLLGGEIWYNWQTATSVLMRTKGITTSRHHSRFFSGLMNKMSTYFWQCPWRAPSKAWKERDETETIFWLLPIGNTVTAESVSVFLMCYQYFLNSYTSYGFTVTNAESHLMRSCVQETAKEWCNETFFHSQEIGKVSCIEVFGLVSDFPWTNAVVIPILLIFRET